MDALGTTGGLILEGLYYYHLENADFVNLCFDMFTFYVKLHSPKSAACGDLAASTGARCVAYFVVFLRFG